MWNDTGNLVTPILVAAEEKTQPFGIDMSIESMSSQQFSTGIFYFLIVAIIVFVGIAFMFMFKDTGKKEGGAKLKTGEKWLFAWIMFGVLVAIVFGAAQMMHGFLF